MTTTGAGELVLQITGETRLVADCSVNPTALVGHVKIAFAPKGVIVSCGALTDPNERLNTVPWPEPFSDLEKVFTTHAKAPKRQKTSSR